MTSASRKSIVLGLALAFSALLATPALAGLSVSDYVDLSIARLEMARTMWSDEGRAPTVDEERALCESYGTSAKEYYRYAGRMKEDIVAYLEENPDHAETIQALSDEIASLVEQTEAEQ